MLKFPEDARVAERRPETDEETVRRQPIRGMIRRMKRNKLRLVETARTQTPFEAMLEWAAELTTKPIPADLADLAERLRGSRLLFDEDGGVNGQAVIDALAKQAGLIRAWPQRARLNTLVGQLHGLLCELGML